MELMQLQMLVAVAEEGTLQKAAERVYRTGPAVSIAIGKLEGELGTPLFDRSGHDFRLTAGNVRDNLLRVESAILNKPAARVTAAADGAGGRHFPGPAHRR